jgi:hypothetical protein
MQDAQSVYVWLGVLVHVDSVSVKRPCAGWYGVSTTGSGSSGATRPRTTPSACRRKRCRSGSVRIACAHAALLPDPHVERVLPLALERPRLLAAEFVTVEDGSHVSRELVRRTLKQARSSHG